MVKLRAQHGDSFLLVNLGKVSWFLKVGKLLLPLLLIPFEGELHSSRGPIRREANDASQLLIEVWR
jgi:hypothetical protein